MSEFKIGDIVRRISYSRFDMPIGFEGVIKTMNLGGSYIGFGDRSDSKFESQFFKLVTPATPVPNLPSRKSPIVERFVTTKTKKLVPGHYGRLQVIKGTDGFSVFGLRTTAWTAPELRDAAATLIELAEFLEEGKN